MVRSTQAGTFEAQLQRIGKGGPEPALDDLAHLIGEALLERERDQHLAVADHWAHAKRLRRGGRNPENHHDGQSRHELDTQGTTHYGAKHYHNCTARRGLGTGFEGRTLPGQCYHSAPGPMITRTRVVALAFCATFALAAPGSGQALLYSLFDRYTDSLRQQTGIPGTSAVIVKNGRVEWERGFGLQDIERSVMAAPDTPYPIGDLTQTLAMVLLGTCAEQGALDIDQPMSRWVSDFPSPNETVRQVMAHAEGGRFRYDPGRFAALTNVAQSCNPKPFRANLADSILERLGMSGSVPGQDLGTPGAPARELFDAQRLDRYEAVLERVAIPYRVDRSLRATRSDFRPKGINAAEGLVSTARDLARFDSALDDTVLLRPETLGVAWSPSNFTGLVLPTGLGWFVQNYQGERLIWHFSYVPDAYSALIVKMPARRVTLIMLANSDGLSRGANLEQGDVTASPFVKIFLRLFV